MGDTPELKVGVEDFTGSGSARMLLEADRVSVELEVDGIGRSGRSGLNSDVEAVDSRHGSPQVK